MVSLAVEQRLQSIPAPVVAAPGLQSTGSADEVHRLSYPKACGVFLDQGANLCLLHWQADSLPLSHQGNPRCLFLIKQELTSLTGKTQACGLNARRDQQPLIPGTGGSGNLTRLVFY